MISEILWKWTDVSRPECGEIRTGRGELMAVQDSWVVTVLSAEGNGAGKLSSVAEGLRGEEMRGLGQSDGCFSQ